MGGMRKFIRRAEKLRQLPTAKERRLAALRRIEKANEQRKA